MRGALILLAALAVASCAPKQEQNTCAPGHKCLHIGNLIDPATIDPQKVSNKNDDLIVGNFIMGLTTDGPHDEPVPGAATSWETSADGKVWTFHLRKDAVWSDGVPVTADDFVYGMTRQLSPELASENSYLLYLIVGAQAYNEGKGPASAIGVKALDPLTVQITLTHPAPYLPELAKYHPMYPAPKHIVEKYGDGWTKDHYVANGPYLYKSSRLGDRLIAVKNPKFYDAANVCIDELYFYPTTDSVAAERRVLRGELDWNNDIQSNRIPRLKRQHPDYVRLATSLSTTYLAFNGHNPKFKDPRVRQALSMTVDRDFIATQLLRGGQKPAYTYIPPGIANYTTDIYHPPWQAWTYAQRQAEARRLLAAAGYGPGHPLKVEITHRNTADPMLFMPAVQADWAAIGVQVSLAPQEGQIAYQSYRARAFEIADAAWSGDYNDPKTFLDQLLSTTGQINYGDYASPVFDELMRQSDQEADGAKRAAIMAKAEGVMIADAPIIPIYFWVNKNLVNPSITGFGDNIRDTHRARWMCKR